MVDNLLSDKAVEKLQKVQKTEHSLFKFLVAMVTLIALSAN